MIDSVVLVSGVNTVNIRTYLLQVQGKANSSSPAFCNWKVIDVIPVIVCFLPIELVVQEFPGVRAYEG